jgi:Rrf2 family protein
MYFSQYCIDKNQFTVKLLTQANAKGNQMLNTRSLHGLKVVAYIAAAPSYQPVTTAKLSRQLGLSVSYTESLMKDLKDGGLLLAHRGPGGGYMLQICVDEMSVWDVAKCFENNDETSQANVLSPESSGLSILKTEFDEIKQHFLQNYPLTEITKHVPKNQHAPEAGFLARHFKPLHKDVLPKAPNSVFDLSNFMQQRAA